MFSKKAHRTMTTLLVGAACLAAPVVARAARPAQVSGSIAGKVNSSAGIPQMGATVQLYNRQERVLAKVLTDDKGDFKFLGLFPDVYSIRVTLATFFPAFKEGILVQPGLRSMLNVKLSTLFSSIQLSYPTLDNGSIMADDWKWVLRGAAASRPVLRFTDDPLGIDSSSNEHARVFSDTRGLLQLSAGQAAVTGVGTEADLGTAFVLATSMFGNSLLQVSGNVGYGAVTGTPTAAFRTSYSRHMPGDDPEVSVMMRQLFLPGRDGMAGESNVPMVRTISAGFNDRARLSEAATLQYGFTMDSVSLLDRMSYFSPYARLTYRVDEDTDLELAYSSGNARPDIAESGVDQETGLRNDLDDLGMFPLISTRSGQTRMQRGAEYEIAVAHKLGSRTYRISAYREVVGNAAMAMVAPSGFLGGADILPDLFSGGSIFNIGDYRSTGYTASITQKFGEHVSATAMYGSTGALRANSELVSSSPDELRDMIRSGRRQAFTARTDATIPWTGTHIIASYQWSGDPRWAVIGNIYSMQTMRPVPGLNLFIRQPIPGFSKRIEATADLRNMLAQGYLPLGTANGQRVLLAPNPRCVRGGLSFIF